MAEILTEAQQERLRTLRAAREEGEDEEKFSLLRQREDDIETLRNIASLLRETDFVGGRPPTKGQMARLLALIRLLAPNPNLDARLLKGSGDTAALAADLRDLLFGETAIAGRIRQFLARQRAGIQTASQLLCAVFPAEWPLITPAARRLLDITPEQRTTARNSARERFAQPETFPDNPGVPDNDETLRLLTETVLFAEVRALLELPNFVEVHRLLTQSSPRRRASVPGFVPAPAVPPDPVTLLREPQGSYRAEPPDATEPAAETEAVLAFLEAWVQAQGFSYPPLFLRSYFLGLQTRPFALLTGLPGTGKTRLTSLFAEALTGQSETQYRLLPVRQDGNASTPLLGQVYRLADGEARVGWTPFLEFLRAAQEGETAGRAFFLCLDEIGLTRAEHLLAELLSAMETPDRALVLPDGRRVRLPSTLFLTATFNQEEGAFAPSRKTLDRANTFLLQDVGFSEETAVLLPENAPAPAARQAAFLRSGVPTVAAARARLSQSSPANNDFAARALQILTEINALLEPHYLHFGYRVRDEVLRFAAASFAPEGNGLLASHEPATNLTLALDLQLLQRILPRLTGPQTALETPLRELLRYAERTDLSHSARRLSRLLARLQKTGYLRFGE